MVGNIAGLAHPEIGQKAVEAIGMAFEGEHPIEITGFATAAVEAGHARQCRARLTILETVKPQRIAQGFGSKVRNGAWPRAHG